MMGGSVMRTARSIGRALSEAVDASAVAGDGCASAARGAAIGNIAAARKHALAGKPSRERILADTFHMFR